MGANKKVYDEKRALELYEKFGSMNRAALSMGCEPSTLKEILIKNGVEIKKYTPKRFNINGRFAK
jgi:rRNA maturation protein Nop10